MGSHRSQGQQWPQDEPAGLGTAPLKASVGAQPVQEGLAELRVGCGRMQGPQVVVDVQSEPLKLLSTKMTRSDLYFLKITPLFDI